MADAEASSSEPPAKPVSKLAVQDLATLRVEELDALSPQVISRQATINIGQCHTPRRCAPPARRRPALAVWARAHTRA